MISPPIAGRTERMVSVTNGLGSRRPGRADAFSKTCAADASADRQGSRWNSSISRIVARESREKPRTRHRHTTHASSAGTATDRSQRLASPGTRGMIPLANDDDQTRSAGLRSHARRRKSSRRLSITTSSTLAYPGDSVTRRRANQSGTAGAIHGSHWQGRTGSFSSSLPLGPGDSSFDRLGRMASGVAPLEHQDHASYDSACRSSAGNRNAAHRGGSSVLATLPMQLADGSYCLAGSSGPATFAPGA